MPFKTLTNEEEKELHRLSRFYWHEALRCEQANAYLAGCVMLGSSLETLLTLMVNAHSEEAEQTGLLPGKKDKPKPLMDWNLGDLLTIAKTAQWLPSALELSDDWNHRKARIGDYAEVARMVRNLAHPARYATDHQGKRVTQKYLQRQFDVVLSCRDWLVERNNKSLLEHMREAGIE